MKKIWNIFWNEKTYTISGVTAYSLFFVSGYLKYGEIIRAFIVFVALWKAINVARKTLTK